jgi:hypothetical protein
VNFGNKDFQRSLVVDCGNGFMGFITHVPYECQWRLIQQSRNGW